MLTLLLLDAYCVGIASSRKIERACYGDLALRVLTGNQQPDHSRISDFPSGPQGDGEGVGWRKALRAAIADNPFVKEEGLSPKARRELLGHSQLALEL